jgi:hypothetical protein
MAAEDYSESFCCIDMDCEPVAHEFAWHVSVFDAAPHFHVKMNAHFKSRAAKK